MQRMQQPFKNTCPLQSACVRIQSKTVQCRAAKTGYKAPSSGAAATELEALSQFSTVVPDTYLMQDLQRLERPKAATVTSSVLSGILSGTSGLREYETAIQRAVGYEKCATEIGEAKYACEMDKALANVGALFAKEVEGRVSTEVDARLAYNTEAIVKRAQNIKAHYDDMKVERFLVRIPGSWEGIQAVKELEAQGIPCHVTLIYSFTQAVAAAQAGASVIQPNIGRLKDWYLKHPGFLKDPKGPREDSGFKSELNPGISLVERIFQYCVKFHPKTRLMVSGIRHKEDMPLKCCHKLREFPSRRIPKTCDALQLAGADYLVVGPKVLEQLNKEYTMQGYNDGLSGSSNPDNSELNVRLTKDKAEEAEFAPEETVEVTKQLFQDGLSQAGCELLEDGIQGLVSDVERLEPVFKKLSIGRY